MPVTSRCRGPLPSLPHQDIQGPLGAHRQCGDRPARDIPALLGRHAHLAQAHTPTRATGGGFVVDSPVPHAPHTPRSVLLVCKAGQSGKILHIRCVYPAAGGAGGGAGEEGDVGPALAVAGALSLPGVRHHQPHQGRD